MLDNIHTQDIRVVPGEVLQTVDGPVGAFAPAVGIAVADKTGIEDAFDDVAEGVKGHPIPEGGRADFALFGFVDVEMGVGTGPIAFVAQFILELEQMIRHLQLKGGHIGPAPFAFGSLAPGQPQIVPFHNR